MTGKEPLYIDHVNRNKTDNRWCNIKECTHQENQWNKDVRADSESKLTGVWQRPSGRWTAYFIRNGKKKQLGMFETKEEAYQARLNSETEYNKGKK